MNTPEPTVLCDSHTWWQATKRDPEALVAWLLDQYRGEATAAGRIEMLRDAYAAPGTRAHRILGVIAGQERRHAVWVGDLLTARGVAPVIAPKRERYWKPTLEVIKDLETGCAVGAHSERMRLERIEVIAGDEEAPADVRAVFQRILPEERFHARAFAELAGDEALAATREAHDLGRRALGLAP
jgi:rubrerythrin